MASIEHIAIDVSAAGSTVLRAAVAGQPIVVLAYTVVCTAEVTVGFSDGADLTGDMPYAANGGASPPYCPVGHFATRPGQALSIVLGGAVSVQGHMTIQIGATLHH